jgi:ATP adenylyltransferase
MNYLFAPWRSKYAQDTGNTKTEKTTEKECVFCNMLKENNDKKNLILRRFAHNFIMLNQFPYNAGHLLIMPLEHKPALHDISKKARNELIELTNKSIEILKNILKAEGINVGLNFGKAAGAGIPSHLHLHVLPRWAGDTNFLPTLSDTKQIPFDLHDIYKQLKPSFDTIKQDELL